MGNSTQSWLRPDEQVIYWARQSPREALHIALMIGFLTAAAKVGIDVYKGNYSPTGTLIFGISSGLAMALPHFIATFRRFELVLTGDRLFYRSGLFLRRSGEVAVADIREIKGPKSGDHPFEVKLNSGESLQITGLPGLGRLREILARAVGAA